MSAHLVGDHNPPAAAGSEGGVVGTRYLVGGYGPDRGGSAAGIGMGAVDADGRMRVAGPLAEALSPSWLTVAGDRVYALLEETAEIASFRLVGDRLDLLSRHPTAGGAPCHAAVVGGAGGGAPGVASSSTVAGAAAGEAVVVASYRTGMLAVHPVGADGSAGPVAQVVTAHGSGPRPAQGGPHAHHVLALPDGRVLSADLGADRVFVHGWNGTRLERTAAAEVPPGTGPRDLCALPDGCIAVLGEWSSSVLLLQPRAASFDVVAEVELWGGDDACQAAALAASHDGRFLYAGLRGPDEVAVVERRAGTLVLRKTVPSGGAWPRHLIVDGHHLHVANQNSNSIVSFRLDDGVPRQPGDAVAAPSPTCLVRLNPAR